MNKGIFRITLLLIAVSISYNSYAQKAILVVPDGITYIQGQAIDKDQKYLYSLTTSKAVMWDIVTGRQLYTFKLDGDEVSSIAISNDGTKLAIAASQKTYCFSTVNGQLIFKDSTYYAGYKGGIIFAPDSKTLIIANKGLNLLDAASGRFLEFIPGHSSGDNAKKIFYAANNSKLVVPGMHSWDVYDMTTKTRIFTKELADDYYLAGLTDQGYVVTTTNGPLASNEVKILDVFTGSLIKKLPLKGIDVSDGVVIPSVNSHQLILCRSDYSSPQRYLFNTDDFTIQKQLKAPIKDIKTTFYFGQNNIIFGLLNNKLVRFNTQSETILQTYDGTAINFNSFSSISYSDSGILNLSPDGNTFEKIDFNKLKPLRYTKTINAEHLYSAISSSGDTVAYTDVRPYYLKFKTAPGAAQVATIKLLNPSDGLLGTLYFKDDGSKLYYTIENSKTGKTAFIKYDFKTKAYQTILSTNLLESIGVNGNDDRLTGVERGRGLTTSFGVWNLATGARLLKVNLVNEEFNDVRNISLSKDSKYALIFEKLKLSYYDLVTGKLVAQSPELDLKTYGRSFTAAVSSDLSQFAVSLSGGFGDVGSFSVYTKGGQLLYTVHAHGDIIRQLLFSPNDKLIYTISDDHTIKVWNTKTGQLLGTLYLFKDSKDFVFVDPEGRFDGSEAGIKQLYFLRGRNLLPLEHLFERYYTPNLYQRLVNNEHLDPVPSDNINPSPKVKISYTGVTRNLDVVDDQIPTYSNTTGVAKITINASAENDKIDEIRLFHNGKIVNLATRGLFVTDNNTGTDSKTYTINLLPGANSIRAIALNSQRTESEPDDISVNYSITGQAIIPPAVNKGATGIIDAIDRNATMHLVVVGINAYKNQKMRLNYALADATAFKDEAERDARTLISNLKTYFVTDDKADKNGITAALTEVQKNAKPQDVFVFYYAGHGVISEKNKEFYLVPNDVTDLKNIDEALELNGIPSKKLQQYAINIAAQKQVFILDACQSAGAFATLMTNDANQQKSLAVVARSTGTHWIAASGSQQFANEFSQLGHGAFTYVLLKAMKGDAANDKMVTINGLKNYLEVQVPDLMKKYNGTPQYPASYGFGSDFPMELIK